MSRHALPLARVTLHVRLVHQESEGHLERGVDLGDVELEFETGTQAGDERHDPVTERGQVEIKIAQRLDMGAIKADLFLCFAQCRSRRIDVARINLSTGNRNLAGLSGPMWRTWRQ